MKTRFRFLFILFVFGSLMAGAQDFTNYISCRVNKKEYVAEARRMNIPTPGFSYLGIAAFQVNPDVQVWIRFYFFTHSLKPGTYPIMQESELESVSRKKAPEGKVWVLVDYTEETKGLGHAYHDGESLSGTVTVNRITETSVEGTFEAVLTGVYYEKRALATMTGSGIRSNIEKKILTGAGAGMIANAGPHDHENTRKTKQTDVITLSEGRFFVDWSKPPKEEK